MSVISLGISTCPNDTFIFDAWVNGKLSGAAPPVSCRLEDIETLNALARQGDLDVVKISLYAFGHVSDRYRLINAGGAMGRGCGPLVVARAGSCAEALLSDGAARVAVPGRLTTANLLLSLYAGNIRQPVFMRFDEIMSAVQRGEVDCGVVIHESRFTLHHYALAALVDLGRWWESATGLPLPLGVIAVRKSLGREAAVRVESAVRASLAAARRNPGQARLFMQRHAGEMDATVMQKHVDLYVNDFTVDYGTEGRAAIGRLLGRAREAGLLAGGQDKA